jgi:hypothetical protein
MKKRICVVMLKHYKKMRWKNKMKLSRIFQTLKHKHHGSIEIDFWLIFKNKVGCGQI